VGPKQIRLNELIERIQKENYQELILAFDATLEGDATALYLKQQLDELKVNIKISRTALGLPAGSSVEYLDPSTLEQALKHRFEIS
jgi:recombination protein RecR